ncbi:hypothetical protein BpHYR1_016163 [Brachionus plicatilis]|uniref:Uncharacterized protein n=1 Tax=Brachionus plicatilis TaxID=10195 RepID=A0A3M7QIM7_BRAPC|nr:hypothetical protein BpHYR1_016163 [Brachionus plicatilis]
MFLDKAVILATTSPIVNLKVVEQAPIGSVLIDKRRIGWRIVSPVQLGWSSVGVQVQKLWQTGRIRVHFDNVQVERVQVVGEHGAGRGYQKNFHTALVPEQIVELHLAQTSAQLFWLNDGKIFAHHITVHNGLGLLGNQIISLEVQAQRLLVRVANTLAVEGLYLGLWRGHYGIGVLVFEQKVGLIRVRVGVVAHLVDVFVELVVQVVAFVIVQLVHVVQDQRVLVFDGLVGRLRRLGRLTILALQLSDERNYFAGELAFFLCRLFVLGVRVQVRVEVEVDVVAGVVVVDGLAGERLDAQVAHYLLFGATFC